MFRGVPAGDRPRGQYQSLSQDTNSLSSLDQKQAAENMESCLQLSDIELRSGKILNSSGRNQDSINHEENDGNQNDDRGDPGDGGGDPGDEEEEENNGDQNVDQRANNNQEAQRIFDFVETLDDRGLRYLIERLLQLGLLKKKI